MTTTLHDLTYATVGTRSLVLDLYLPDSHDAATPVFVYLHGGGWKVGDKQADATERFASLTSHGFAVASVGYRLSGEAIYPAALHDVKAAVRWLRASASTYQLDPDRIALGGASAGGHLASLAALTADDPELEGTVGEHTTHSSRVGAVVAWYPPTDLLFSSARSPFEARLLSEPSAIGFLGLDAQAPDGDALRRASPRWRVTPSAPPHLLLHGDRDAVVPLEHSRLLHDALVGCGAHSSLFVLGGAGHEDPKLETPAIAAMIAGFLHEHLGH